MFILDILCIFLLAFATGVAGLALAVLIWHIAANFIDPFKPPRKYR